MLCEYGVKIDLGKHLNLCFNPFKHQFSQTESQKMRHLKKKEATQKIVTRVQI